MAIPGNVPPPLFDPPPSSDGSCEFEVTPVEAATMPLGGSGQFSIVTASHCAWTVTTQEDWVLPHRTSGTGSATVGYDVAPWSSSAGKYNGDLRETPIQVRWDTPTVGQNVWIYQMPYCSIYIFAAERRGVTVTPSGFQATEFFVTLPAAGGRFTLDVLAESPFTCPWQVRSQASWISFPFAGLGIRRGDSEIIIDLSPNTSGTTRTARLEVGEKLLTVVQSGQ